MKIRRIYAAIFSLLLLLAPALSACGNNTDDVLEGKKISIDGDDGSVCFFGATEEIRALYDALAEGDGGVASYLAEREAAHEYMDTLAPGGQRSGGAVCAHRYSRSAIAVFPEEEFASTYYIRSVYPKVHRPEYSTFDPTGMTDLRVLYNLEEVQHFDEHFDRNRCVSVVVNYNRSKTILESYTVAGDLAPIQTLEIDGYSMKIYVDQKYDGSFYAYATILTEESLTKITVPVESGEDGAKNAVGLLLKARITTLREVLGLK